MKTSSGKIQKKRRQPSHEEAGLHGTGTSVPEWIMAAISCVALMAVLVYLVFDGLNTDDGMADIHLLQGEIVRTDGGYAVEFSALNRSRKSVAAVEIEGELRNGDEILEESRVTLDYLPQRSERNGALSFRRNPQAHEIHLFAGGYTEP